MRKTYENGDKYNPAFKLDSCGFVGQEAPTASTEGPQHHGLWNKEDDDYITLECWKGLDKYTFK